MTRSCASCALYRPATPTIGDCAFPIAPPRAMPSSVAMWIAPTKARMGPDAGLSCPTWETADSEERISR